MTLHRYATGFLVCTTLVLSVACDVEEPAAPSGDDLAAEDADDGELGKADGAESSFTYFRVERDYRKCVYPLCGGYWVSRVNRYYTRCDDGSWQERCYVTDLDFGPSGLGEKQVDELTSDPENVHVLLRGEIGSADWDNFGQLGRLDVSEAWIGASDNEPDGLFVRVADSGIRCFAAPCFNTLYESKLNSVLGTHSSELDLSSWTDLTEDEVAGAYEQLYTDDGILVAGFRYYFFEQGWQKGRVAVQFYTRVQPVEEPAECVRAGCSSQLCVEPSEGDIVTTCEWLPQYACLQAAPCERQPNGTCGHTPSAELDACLEGAG